MWGQVIQFIVAVAVAILASKQIPGAQPAEKQEINPDDLPSIDLGKTPPVMWGTRLMQGNNVAWYGNIQNVPIYSSGGGKK